MKFDLSFWVGLIVLAVLSTIIIFAKIEIDRAKHRKMVENKVMVEAVGKGGVVVRKLCEKFMNLPVVKWVDNDGAERLFYMDEHCMAWDVYPTGGGLSKWTAVNIRKLYVRLEWFQSPWLKFPNTETVTIQTTEGQTKEVIKLKAIEEVNKELSPAIFPCNTNEQPKTLTKSSTGVHSLINEAALRIAANQINKQGEGMFGGIKMNKWFLYIGITGAAILAGAAAYFSWDTSTIVKVLRAAAGV